VSLEDWNGMQETAYLLGTEANRKLLLDSIAEAERGETLAVEVDAQGGFRVAGKP
jgi:PHD/YefM family antitoxin component YafN of YafNO toxin-antitoxin module